MWAFCYWSLGCLGCFPVTNHFPVRCDKIACFSETTSYKSFSGILLKKDVHVLKVVVLSEHAESGSLLWCHTWPCQESSFCWKIPEFFEALEALCAGRKETAGWNVEQNWFGQHCTLLFSRIWQLQPHDLYMGCGEGCCRAADVDWVHKWFSLPK